MQIVGFLFYLDLFSCSSLGYRRVANEHSNILFSGWRLEPHSGSGYTLCDYSTMSVFSGCLNETSYGQLGSASLVSFIL